MDTADGLTGCQLLALLSELDLELNNPVSLLIAGGAALAMRWNLRYTNDVDVVSEGMTAEVRAAAARVGQRYGLREDWLNDGAKGFAPRLHTEPDLVFSGEHLQTYTASAEYLLAMKLVSAREEDTGDIAFLVNETGMVTVDDLLRLVEDAYPHRPIPVAVRYLIEEVVSGIH